MEDLNKLAEKIYNAYYWITKDEARLGWLNDISKERIEDLVSTVNNIKCDSNSLGAYGSHDVRNALESLLILCYIHNIDLNKEFAYAND